LKWESSVVQNGRDGLWRSNIGSGIAGPLSAEGLLVARPVTAKEGLWVAGLGRQN